MVYVYSGTPEPEVDWYKDNRVIREGGRMRFLFEDDGLCSLLIREAESSDRGRYKCVASNPAGKVQCSAELFIESKYLIFLLNAVFNFVFCDRNQATRCFFCLFVCFFTIFCNFTISLLSLKLLLSLSCTGHGFDSTSGSDYERRLSR